MNRRWIAVAAAAVAATVSAVALAGEALSPEERAKRARERVAAAQAGIEKQKEIIAAWAASPELVAALKEHNAKGPLAGMDNAKWAGLAATDPIVTGLVQNAAGKFLKSKIDVNPKLYAEAFLCGAKGEKAGFTTKTTFYLHKGKPKFDVPFESGKVWQGKAEFDESSQTYSIQVAAPVVDSGKPVGVLVATLALVELEKAR